MQRRRLNISLDWLLLVAALVAFPTGVVLLLCFHMGNGAFATTALGLGKLAWLNLHRFAAAVLVATVVSHVALHWRAFRKMIMNFVTRATKKRIRSEPLMYGAFFIAAVTGLVAWLALEGSSPLFGPALIGRASGTRHPWVDAHHITSLMALLLVAHHVRHRFRLMRRGSASVQRVQQPEDVIQRGARVDRGFADHP
jgi:hypothetical protein